MFLCDVTSVPINFLPVMSVCTSSFDHFILSFLLKFVTGFFFHGIGINWVSKTRLHSTYCSARHSCPWEASLTRGSVDASKSSFALCIETQLLVPGLKGHGFSGCIFLDINSFKIIYHIFIPLAHVDQVLRDFHLIPKRK